MSCREERENGGGRIESAFIVSDIVSISGCDALRLMGTGRDGKASSSGPPAAACGAGVYGRALAPLHRAGLPPRTYVSPATQTVA